MKQSVRKLMTVLIASALLLTLVLAQGCGRKEDPSEHRAAEEPAKESMTADTDPEEPAGDESASEEPMPEPSAYESEPSETEEPENSGSEESNVPEASGSEEALPPLDYVDGYRIRIVVDSARIRDAASLESEVIGSAVKGDVLDVIGTEGRFYVIDLSGVRAFVHESVAEYGAFEKETQPEPGTSTPVSRPEYVPNNGRIICLDAGHKPGGGISEMEPNGPGSSVMKAKLTTGTQGSADGVVYYEYAINGQVTDKLKQELESRGYTVVTVDRNLSNAERALAANASGASAFIRIHCNGSNDHSVAGFMTYAPTNANPYMGASLIAESIRLSDIIGRTTCAATGAQFRGRLGGDDMTGINWCTIPVTIVEMGFMSNEAECRLLASDDYQWKLAKGMANGIDEYLGR